MLDICNLMELEAHGPLHTWSNRRVGSANIKIKLDHAFSNQEWRKFFIDVVVIVRPLIESDHLPILVETTGGKPTGKRPFWFERSIQEYPREIEKCLRELEILQDCPPSTSNQAQMKEIEDLLKVEYQREEMHWHQKSRIHWLTSGDRNTRFFHASTLQRRHRNKILKLRTLTGKWTESEREVITEISNHYKDIFTSKQIDNEVLQMVLLTISPLVDNATNEMLCRIADNDEIKQTVFAMASLKSLWPDGLPPTFF
ncbi:uncharacterized protein LOC122643392 [Telopea speciosissima]|uniref:uncharacterized protein LOC122643392 n=1 Tax=Telopea speciosissima TaxID=54955 RepID=UPI001CC57CD1|nr:uncharacterized protein LOC122643392 [Telopea speciosissima]